MKVIAITLAIIAIVFAGCQTIPINKPVPLAPVIEEFHFVDVNREPLTEVRKGEQFAVYLSLSNVTHHGEVNLSFIFKVTMPGGDFDTITLSYAKVDQTEPIELFTLLTAPLDYPVGIYTFKVIVQDVVTGYSSVDTASLEFTYYI